MQQPRNFYATVLPSARMSKKPPTDSYAAILRQNAAQLTKKPAQRIIGHDYSAIQNAWIPAWLILLVKGAEALKRVLAAILLSTHNGELTEDEAPIF